MNATTSLLSLSGAQLRAEPTNPAYVAELARRQAKREASGKVTVAALRSWGRTDEADAIKAAAKAAKPASAPKAAKGEKAADTALVAGKGVMGAMLAGLKADPAYLGTPAPTFTRAEVTVPKAKKATLTTRMDQVEQSLLALADLAKSQHDLLQAIVSKLAA